MSEPFRTSRVSAGRSSIRRGPTRLARRRAWPGVALACLLLAAPTLVHAEGFRLLDHGTAAAGQASAFAAQADDPSALYYNPAGLTQLPGFQAYVGVDFLSSVTSFTNTLGQTVRGGSDGIINPPPVNAYVSYSLKELGLGPLGDLSLGVGVTSPFGLKTSYPSTGPLATVTTYAALPLLDIKPTAAYRLGPYLALGAGLDIYTFSDFIGDGQAEQKRFAGPELAQFGIPPGAALEFNGTDTAVGFNISALITPFRTDGKPRLNIGLVYRSSVTLNLTGDFLLNGTRVAGAETKLTLPWVFTGAVAGWPLRDAEREWKIEVDVDYAEWSSFDNLNIKLSTGTTLPFPQNWRSGYVVMAGTEYKWLTLPNLPGWEVAARAGYFYSSTPVPTKTFGPAIPDADFNAFSLGLGFLCRAPARLLGLLPCGSEQGQWWAPKALGIDIAYQLVLSDARRISNNDDPRVNGLWNTTTNWGSVALRFNF
jgi:long-chain fatty acid transport protein